MILAIPFFLVAAGVSDYAGSAVCQKCHPAEFERQSASAHAHALAPSKAPQPGQWAFGAGEQAITFVTRLAPDAYLEEGRSWFRRLDAYGPTPGAKSSAGTRYRTFDPAAGILRCFACHSTGPLSMSKEEAVEPHELGVRCEACHGGAAAHVRDPAKARPFNPGRLSADRLNEFCGNCHRMPAGADETPDLRNPWNARHQPLLLAESACFRRSQGKLSCLTCHAPHAPLETSLAKYDAACAGCHAGVRHEEAVKGPCAGCHMPEVKPLPGLAFANHRIAVYGAGDAVTPVVRKR